MTEQTNFQFLSEENKYNTLSTLIDNNSDFIPHDWTH